MREHCRYSQKARGIDSQIGHAPGAPGMQDGAWQSALEEAYVGEETCMQVRMLPELLVDTHQTYPFVVIRLHRHYVLTSCEEDVCCHSELRGLIGQRPQDRGRGEPVYLMPLFD